jgi:hypothetical protein
MRRRPQPGRHRLDRVTAAPLTLWRREAYGWACLYGVALGLAAVACQDAQRQQRPGWAALFALYGAWLAVAYFALQWRELRG